MAMHRLSSVVMGVPDTAKTAAYYADFGLSPGSDGWFSTRDGGRQLRVVQAPTRRLVEVSIGVDTPDDLAAAAARLSRLGIPVWIRYVLVPGRTDDETSVDGLGTFLSALPNIERVDVLPFHKLGAHKYDALGLPFPLRDTHVPDQNLIERVREQFRGHGLRAV